MSTVTESRVVELRFDNKEFEANARETLNTLDELKRALEQNISGEAFNELDRAARSVDLSGIEAGIEALTDRFSTMGIVGMTVIQNITNALTNTLGSAVHSLFDSITSGGLRRAQNIENARFQLQGILNDAAKVEEVMANASESVDGTAYALDSAAKAASQLAASGVEAGDQMTNVLKGIAGVAATTSTDYEGVSRIFTQIAGQGRLMGDQLLQLSNRGLNAAATLTNYINGVKNGTIETTDAIKEQVSALTGASTLATDAADAVQQSSKDILKNAQKAANAEYKALQKSYQQERKELQKELNEEYNIKKKAYDKEYKLRQTELNKQYQELQKSLNEEVEAVQEANQKRLEEVQETYEKDVEAYRKATDERISLINKEYKESIKLIDEEKYEKLNAIDEKIKAIQDQSKAEQKALKDSANEEKRLYLQNALEQAKGSVTRQKAAEALAELEAQLERERLAEERANQIEELQNEKENIRDEYAKKKEEAQEKAQAAKEAVQEESSAELKAMQKAHQENLKQIRKQQAEEISAMREANSERLSALKESQSAELEILREGQSEQLSILKEAQQARLEHQNDIIQSELERVKESQAAQLEALSESFEESSGKAAKWAAKFGGVMDLTEGDLRDMVSDGLISFDLFSSAMADTFGEHAYDANKTFQGALSNVRAALARTGAMFYQPLITEGAPAIDLLNEIRLRINEINKVLAPIAETVTGAINDWIPKLTAKIHELRFAVSYTIENARKGNETITKIYPLGNILSNVLKSIINLLSAIGSYIKPVIDAFREVFTLDFGAMEKGSESFEKLTASLKANDNAIRTIKRIFIQLFSVIKNGFTIVKSILGVFKPLFQLFGEGEGVLGSLLANVTGLISGFTNWLVTSEKVKEVFETLTYWVGQFVSKVIGIKTAVASSFQDAFFGFDIGKYFTEGFFNGMVSLIPDVLKRVWDFGKSLLSNLMGSLDEASPSKATFKIGVNFVQGLINGIISLVKKAAEIVVNMAKSLVTAIKNFFDGIDWKDVLSTVSNAAVTFITTFGEKITNGIPNAIDAVANFFSNVKSEIQSFNAGEEAGENFLSSFIHGLGNVLTSAISTVKDIFSTLFTSIKEHLTNFSVTSAIQSGKEFVTNLATTIINKIKEWTGPVGEAIGGLFGNLTPEGLIAVGAGLAMLYGIVKVTRALNEVLNPLSQFSRVLGTFTKTLKSYSLDLKANAILKISAAVAILVGTITAMYKLLGEDLDVGKFLLVTGVVAAVLAGISFIIYKLMEINAQVNKATTEYQELAKGLKAIEGALAVSLVIKTVANVLGTIVLAIGGLVLLYNQYSSDVERAVQLFGFITLAILAIIAVFAVTSSKIKTGTEQSKNMAVAFLAMAAAIFLIVNAINQITKIDFDFKKNSQQLLLLAGIVLIVGYLAKQMVKTSNSLSGGEGSISASVIIGFCVLLIATIYALKKLINMQATLKNNWQQLVMIGVIFGILLVVLKALNKVTASGGGALKAGGTIFGIIAFLVVSVAAIGILSLMPFDKYLSGLAKVAGIFVVLGIACSAASKVTNGDGYKSIMAVGAIVAVLAVTIGALSMLDTGTLFTTVLALAGVLLALGAALNGAGKVKPESAASIFGMLGIIIGIGILMIMTQDIPWQNLLSLAGGIAGVLLAMGVCINTINSEGTKFNKEIALSYISGLVSILAIGFILKYLSEGTSWDQVLAMAGGIAGVLLAMGYCISIVSSEGTKFNKEILANYIAGLVSVAAIGFILNVFSTQPWDQVLALGTSIAEVLLAMAVCIGIVSSEGTNFSKETVFNYIAGLVSVAVIGLILQHFSEGTDWQALLGMGGAIASVLIAMAVCLGIVSDNAATWQSCVASAVYLAEGVAAVAGIGYILHEASQGTDWDKTLAMGVAIGVVLIAMAVTMSICAAIGTLGQAGIVGIGILDAFIIDLAAVLYGLGAICSDPSVQAIMENGGEVLALIGEALGKFVGAIVEGVLEKVSDAFPKIGENLSGFAENAKGFFDALSNLDGGTVLEAAGALTGVILALGAAEMMDAVTNLFSWFKGGNDEDSFGKKLESLGESLTTFYNNTKEIENAYRFKMIAEAAGYLIEMATNVPNSGGWLGTVLGENDIDDFGEKLATFSKHMMTVAAYFAVIPIELSKFKQIAEATQVMIDMATTIPNSGGWLGNVLGNNDIDDFGKRLATFAKHMMTVSTYFAIMPIEPTKFSTIAKAMKPMIEMATSIPNSGGWLGSIVGNNDIDDFGKRLATFSKHLLTVSINLGAVNPTKISEIAEAMKDMIGVASKIKKEKLADGGWIKDGTLEKFGKNLVSFGEQIRILVTDKLPNIERLNVLTANLTMFMALVPTLNTFTGAGFTTFLNNLGTYGTEGLKKFCDSFTGSRETIVTAVSTMFSNVGSAITSKKDLMEGYGRITAKYLTSGIEDGIKNISNISIAIGTQLSASFGEGLRTSVGQVSIAIRQMLVSATAILKTDTSMLNGGKEAATKYSLGLTSNNKVVMQSIKLMLTTATAVLKSDLLFMTSGRDSVTKYSMGITANSKMAMQSVRAMLTLLNGYFKTDQTFMNAGKENADKFAKGFSANTSVIAMTISTFMRMIGEVLRNYQTFREGGFESANKFGRGFSDNSHSISSAVEEVLRRIADGARNSSHFYEAGRYVVEGFVRGIRDNLRDARDAGRDLGNAAYEAAKRSLDERSPSKKMAQVGSFAGEGFVQGFAEWVKAAARTGTEVGESAQEGLVDALSNIAQEIQNEEDFTPVITPVLDLSNVEANARELGGILNLDKPLQLAANAGMSFTGGLNNLLSNIQASIPDNSNEDVVTAINSLRTDINVLGDKVAAMQVIMDTGELVGAISAPIDDQLGFRTTLIERGAI